MLRNFLAPFIYCTGVGVPSIARGNSTGRTRTVAVSKKSGRPACIEKGLRGVAAQQPVEDVTILGHTRPGMCVAFLVPLTRAGLVDLIQFDQAGSQVLSIGNHFAGRVH